MSISKRVKRVRRTRDLLRRPSNRSFIKDLGEVAQIRGSYTNCRAVETECDVELIWNARIGRFDMVEESFVDSIIESVNKKITGVTRCY